MTVHQLTKTFHILPVISVTKNINPLSDVAKITFYSNWNYYWTIKIGWLKLELNY